ncbi:MAG: CRISPR system precrRNA processing endoribonuclease RAMP protein Cas6 [Deltaproteobacteria bacterium]|nr:CRISPR system precrRNA processing endoribonuclease RAMP protein Cas6 [Deltaproteobacteria bacterium]
MNPLAIKVGRFTITLRTREPIILPPYKGSTLRGGFGHAFKKVVCALRDKDCADCLLKNQCVYSYVFETPPPTDTTIMRKYQKVPHPFIIEPPLEKKQGYKPGDELTFGLTLIGKAIDYLPYFVYAFEELGKAGLGRGRGKFDLKEVRSLNRSGAEHNPDAAEKETGPVIYSSKTRMLSSFEAITLPISMNGTGQSDSTRQSITINFLTPTRIIYNGHRTLMPELEFHTLIRQLLRRITLLSYFHCGIDISGWDFKGIIEAAKAVTAKENNLRWYDWERYSGRQDKKIKMGGFTGRICFEGNIKPFEALLEIGETLHIGKSTGFGMGGYRTENIDGKVSK